MAVSFRQALESLFTLPKRKGRLNIFKGKTEFRAQILTRPLPIAGAAKATDDPETRSKLEEQGIPSKYQFICRLLDDQMAHNKFLEDPCYTATTPSPEETALLVSLHSRGTVSTDDLNAGQNLQPGDMIYVTVDPGDSEMPYDLQNVTFSRVDTFFRRHSAKLHETCTTLAQQFADGGWSTVGEPAEARACPPESQCSGYVQAKYYKARSGGTGAIKMVVIHATAGPSGGGRARSGAERMSAGPTVPDGYGGTKEVYTSAHYFVDQSGYVWQGVDDKDSAQHAGATVNNKSIGIEHTGFPVQLRDNAPTIWNDEIYRASARLGAYLVGSYGIPIVRITDPGGEGFIAHSDISTDRTDPGPNWDWDKYLALIKEYYDANDFAAKVDPSAPAVASASTDEEHDAEEDTG